MWGDSFGQGTSALLRVLVVQSFRELLILLMVYRITLLNPFLHMTQYAVELLPFESTLFRARALKGTSNEGKNETSNIMASYPVTIATQHGEGPIPTPVTKPKPRKERAGLRNSTDFAVLNMFRTL